MLTLWDLRMVTEDTARMLSIARAVNQYIEDPVWRPRQTLALALIIIITM